MTRTDGLSCTGPYIVRNRAKDGYLCLNGEACAPEVLAVEQMLAETSYGQCRVGFHLSLFSDEIPLCFVLRFD